MEASWWSWIVCLPGLLPVAIAFVLGEEWAGRETAIDQDKLAPPATPEIKIGAAGVLGVLVAIGVWTGQWPLAIFLPVFGGLAFLLGRAATLLALWPVGLTERCRKMMGAGKSAVEPSRKS